METFPDHILGFEFKILIFVEVKFLFIFTELSEDSGGHIFQPNTKCLSISESLRPTLNYPIKLIDLWGQLRLLAASKGFKGAPL